VLLLSLAFSLAAVARTCCKGDSQAVRSAVSACHEAAPTTHSDVTAGDECCAQCDGLCQSLSGAIPSTGSECGLLAGTETFSRGTARLVAGAAAPEKAARDPPGADSLR